MFWQKLQHHFFFFFLSFVLLAQSLIFVVSEAVPFKIYQLKSTWLSPQNGQILVSGQKIYLQAKFETKNKKIAAIYFVLADPSGNHTVNFETQKNNQDIYSSLSTWDTAEWPTGIYSLNARAKIINDQGKIIREEESALAWIKIISSEEYNKLSENAPSTITGAVLGVSTRSASDLGDNFGTNSLVIDQATDNSTSTNDTSATSTMATSTPSDNATSTTVLAPNFELIAPENNTTINSRSFLVRFLTNFLTDLVTIEFINTDNAAISTGSISIDKTDGYNWVKNLELSDTIVNGSYKLLVSAIIPDSGQQLVKSFDYNLNVPIEIKPEDLFLNLVNLSSNVQGQVGLRAEVNFNIPTLDFVIEDSINYVEALRIKGVNVSSASSTGANFLSVWDTAVLPNGNYLVYVESKIGQQKVGSPKQLVTVYNAKNELATSTNNDTTTDEIESGPNVPEQATSTVSTVSAITPSNESSIDCQRSGISDQNLCQKYQAELNDSLPQICLEKSIFVGADCEKYIFENENKVCLDNKIEDATKCRDYLYKKYSPDLLCDIRDAVDCPQAVVDNYIGRLAYMSDEKNKYVAVIGKLNNQALTLNSLSDQLLAADLANSSLPLIASDKYIEVLKIKNKNFLDLAGNLFISSPAAIMGDKDGDLLPDDLESYYNTDPNKADSDGDGFNDGQELFNNYNPLGDGKLQQERTALDQILLSKLSLEEPKSSTISSDNNWLVSEANSVDGVMQISGKATPNTWVNIFVYSQIPFLATVKSDINGAWSYGIGDPLTEGIHQVYIGSNDKSGKLLARSEPLTFLVANIQNDLPPVGAGQQINVTNEKSTETNWTIYYIVGGVFIFLVLLGFILLLIKRRRQRPDNLVLQAKESETKKIPLATDNIGPAVKDEIKLPEINLPPITQVESKINSENNNQENRV